ncbi:hypothetical protein SAMN05216552_103619 [Pseudoduganella namucuonensis]|uniref:Uncharacterized protein n=1 Tax=Pseudoduganella namucuonensis TaxID=1035707 RepID=A0A1I7LS72_9BURK|nr:hypothetical protein SAMN05216552_103619 [Pseudoduganella namucuonensis]
MSIVDYFKFCWETQKWPPPVPQTVLPPHLLGDEL